MKKGLLTLSGLALLTILATSGVKKVNYPTGVTGSSTGCSCHGGSAGTVTLKGLPTHVKAGATYPFTLVYAFGSSVTYWGLDIKVTAGTITATGTGYSGTGTTEITHTAAFKSATATYTYTGMSWNTTGLTVGKVAKFTFATLGATVASGNSGAGKTAKGTFSDTIATTNAPVEFSTVSADWVGKNKVNISWKTATETNSSYFEVERSFTGENFAPIAKVSAAGTSETIKSYTVIDEVVGSSKAYYRVKETDKDGTPTYSEIKSVNLKPVKSFVKTLYPNPTVSGQPVNVQYVAVENGKVNIELYNCLGKKMNSLTADAVTGENDIKFNLGRFVSPGIYYVVVSNGIEKIAQMPISVQ